MLGEKCGAVKNTFWGTLLSGANLSSFFTVFFFWFGNPLLWRVEWSRNYSKNCGKCGPLFRTGTRVRFQEIPGRNFHPKKLNRFRKRRGQHRARAHPPFCRLVRSPNSCRRWRCACVSRSLIFLAFPPRPAIIRCFYNLESQFIW